MQRKPSQWFLERTCRSRQIDARSEITHIIYVRERHGPSRVWERSDRRKKVEKTDFQGLAFNLSIVVHIRHLSLFFCVAASQSRCGRRAIKMSFVMRKKKSCSILAPKELMCWVSLVFRHYTSLALLSRYDTIERARCWTRRRLLNAAARMNENVNLKLYFFYYAICIGIYIDARAAREKRSESWNKLKHSRVSIWLIRARESSTLNCRPSAVEANPTRVDLLSLCSILVLLK